MSDGVRCGCRRQRLGGAPDMKDAKKRCCVPAALRKKKVMQGRGITRARFRNLPQLMSRHTASVTLTTSKGCNALSSATAARENMAMVRSVEPVARRLSSLLMATVMMLALWTAC